MSNPEFNGDILVESQENHGWSLDNIFRRDSNGATFVSREESRTEEYPCQNKAEIRCGDRRCGYCWICPVSNICEVFQGFFASITRE
jgi:hypothetical protein